VSEVILTFQPKGSAEQQQPLDASGIQRRRHVQLEDRLIEQAPLQIDPPQVEARHWVLRPKQGQLLIHR